LLRLETSQAVRDALEGMDRPLGFIPTMGALHTGHLALVQAAGAQCKATITSIFVNPLQFGVGEDFERYPRDLQADLSLLEYSGVSAVFAPAEADMFPPGFSTSVDVGAMARCFEGAVRPHHFRGVATVVLKLLNIVAPDIVFFGQKDAQQSAVVRKLVRELSVAVDVQLIATQRESDGLAMSSRNRYLNEGERAAAPSLHAALQIVYLQLLAGRSREAAFAAGKAVLHPLAKLDYLELVDADTFQTLEQMRPPAFIIGAAAFGTTRLIDNIWIRA